MPEPTNRDRAEWARAALSAYPPCKDEDITTQCADLVSDILHPLRREGGVKTSVARRNWLLDCLDVNEVEILEDEEG